ncbi:MAG: hypothetical protein AAGK23_00995, partial [Pseudomonadota bacterium]
MIGFTPLILFLLLDQASPKAQDNTVIYGVDAVPETCGGVLTQGGLIICEGKPGTRFTLGETTLTADDTGAVAFGLGRRVGSYRHGVQRWAVQSLSWRLLARWRRY